MTRDETKKILMVVQAAYSNFNPPDRTVTVDTWYRFLSDYTYDQVDAAVDTYIRSDTSGFAPDIGKVIEKLQTLFMENSLNEMAAWGMVLRAIRNSGYHAEEEFARLPVTVQKAVVSPGQLREWALADMDECDAIKFHAYIPGCSGEGEGDAQVEPGNFEISCGGGRKAGSCEK